VRRGRSLDATLPDLQAGETADDRALIAALAYGALRELRLLDILADELLQRPPKATVRSLIVVGLYQLRAMRVPAHAAVHATVAATAELGQPRARGLVNAVLRRYQREAQRLEAKLPGDPGVRYSHPDWLVERLRADWPDRWEAILAADNRPAPMALRVNRRRVARDAYRQRLADTGIPATPVDHAADALVLDEPWSVERLPGFADGDVSVQDVAAQLAAALLDVRPGMRVLDACAAPGGKAAHCLELADCELTAVDIDAQRLERVEETFHRLGFHALSPSVARGERIGERGAVLVQGDATDPRTWWNGHPYDRILLDAPCTGTGVIRRHPDIKWLRRESDVAALAERQRALLEALWPLLAPGGVLVYATCSVLRAEGADVVTGFLADTADAAEDPIAAEWGEAEAAGRRIAAGEADMDGFYYARLARQVGSVADHSPRKKRRPTRISSMSSSPSLPSASRRMPRYSTNTPQCPGTTARSAPTVYCSPSASDSDRYPISA